MPNVQVNEYLAQQIGVNPGRPNQLKDSNAMIEAAKQLGTDLACVLYNAFVKLDGDTGLSGPGLTAPQLQALGRVATKASKSSRCPQGVREHLRDFAGAAERYAQFLKGGNTRTDYVSNVIKKKPLKAIEHETRAVPRHTLIRLGTKLYEVLTWMTTEEQNRLASRFANTNGLFSLLPERNRIRTWGSGKYFELKTTLGSGGFGSARVARDIGDDQYLVIKKVHQCGNSMKPAITPITPRVNDGSLSGVSRLYGSFFAESTRSNRPYNDPMSAYTLCELGVVDVHTLKNIFLLMAFALNHKNEKNPKAKDILLQMVKDENPHYMARNIFYLSSNPCYDQDTVRKFRNTLAYQILEAVQQMHSHDRAHNDIKPDNFVLAYDANNLLRVKLIDFDLNASIKNSVGKARRAYTASFSAPQVSKSGVNNQADRNDAYSVGCTFRALNGESSDALRLKRVAAKGIMNQKKKWPSPVEDRRLIEARFTHLPELTTVADLANLLSNPHSGKRYTIAEALQSPLFTRSNNLLSPDDFSRVAEKIIRQGHMIPRKLIDGLSTFQRMERLDLERLGPAPDRPLGIRASCLEQQDDQLLLEQYKRQYGEARLKSQMGKIKRQVFAENGLAILRRGLRQLNVSYHLMSPASREASYVYPSSRR